MRVILNPTTIAGVLILLAIFGIGTAVYREVRGLETRMWTMREGFLNEIAQLAVSSLTLSLKDGRLNHSELQAVFANFEHLDARKFYGIPPSREGVALEFLVTNPQGRVLYDSTSIDTDKDLSCEPEISAALNGTYQKRVVLHQGIEKMYVAISLRIGDRLEGVVRVGKPATILTPILKEAQMSLILVGVAGMVVAFLVVLLVFLLLLKPLDLWFSYKGLFNSENAPRRPKQRRTRFNRFGEMLNHLYQSLSGRSYVDEVLSNLSHELKSPVTSVRGILRILARPIPEGDRDDFLSEAHQQLDRMQTVIERMMALASLEKREALKELEPVLIMEAIHGIVADLKPIIRNAEARIQIEPSPEMTLHCDAFLTRQGITNLLLNALEHSSSGCLITVSAQMKDQYLEVSIRDQGQGIPTDATDQIFDKFFTLPHQGISPTTGTGLGLNFVRQVVELHFGDLSVTNHPEGGVVARLRFPLTLVSSSAET